MKRGRTDRSTLRLCGVVAARAVAIWLFAAAAPGAQPTALTAFHRSGQTFLTWQEDNAINGEGYHVYRHTAAVNAANIGSATRLTERWGPLPEGSSIFYTERDRDPGGSVGVYTGLQNYVITDFGPELDDTTGLFVWTAKESGGFYYAVTTVEGGIENRTDFSPGNSLAGAISETVADPWPVLVWASVSGNSRVFTQFMDFETFNPTFERPTEGLQYAYNYWVGLPTAGMCGGSVPSELPLYLQIEGYGTRYEVHEASTWGWCCAVIWADDPRQSWYYGFSSTFDYRTGGVPDTGPIVNYAEQRILRCIYDTLRDPAYNIDAQRITVYGHSMGGSGALALGMRYPNVFAASYSSEPMTHYAASSWGWDLEPKWGAVSSALPIENRGRYAAHLTAYDGTDVWAWQNHRGQLVSRRGDEMAHISLAHGTLDDVIDWATQGQPAYEPFYRGRRAFSGQTLAMDHTWMSFAGMGPNVADYDSAGPFYGFAVVRNESMPGLSYASGSSPVPPPGADANYNMNIEWSSSWLDWDSPPVDTASEWRISLRTTDGSTQTVDVTARRLQNLAVSPGRSYAWENHLVADNSLVASGSIAADAQGLVTVSNFTVSAQGNRLVLLAQGCVGPWCEAVDLGGGWRWLAWFGTFNVDSDPWVFHNEHGWMYRAGESAANLWFWTADMGWLWTSDTAYPFLYRNQDGAWLWYLRDTDDPRWFYNFATQAWESV
ncbi:alpha/beta hydrolase-fold protein [Verrucomicrobiota bacterium]